RYLVATAEDTALQGVRDRQSPEGGKGEVEERRKAANTLVLFVRSPVLNSSFPECLQFNTSGRMRRVCSRKKLLTSRAVSRRNTSWATWVASSSATDRMTFLISGILWGVTLNWR